MNIIFEAIQKNKITLLILVIIIITIFLLKWYQNLNKKLK